MTDRDALLIVLSDRAAVLDPDAVLLAAAVLQGAMPVIRRENQENTVPVDVEAVQLIIDLYVARHSALASAAEANLVNFLLLALDRFPPGGLPTALAADAWHLQAGVLSDVSQLDGRLDLLHTAVTMWQHVVAVTPPDQPQRPTYLVALAAALLARFDGAYAREDLDGAVAAMRTAVAALADGDAERPRYLSFLCLCLTKRSDQSGAAADLDEAIAAGQAAMAGLPVDDPAALDCLGNLAGALQNRFEHLGQRADLDEAIDIFQAALAAGHARQEFQLAVQRNLCGALLARFRYAGDAADLAAATATGRAAVNGSSPDDPGWAVGLGNLAAALRAQYEQKGALPDLAEAIAASKDAAGAVPDGDPGRAVYLGMLAMSLLTLAERTESLDTQSLDYADQAVAASRSAAGAVPDGHPNRPGYLSGLGAALRHRFNLTGRMDDLDQAIEVGHDAVDTTPAGHPDRGGYLTNLSLALRARYERSNDLADLDASLSASGAALAAMAADRPDHARVQLNLGRVLATSASADGGGWVVTEMEQARQAFEQAARSDIAEHSIRLQAAQAWGEWAGNLGDWPDAVRGYEEAVRLLGESTWRGLDRDDQMHILAQSWGLAADAAAAAVLAGRPERAVELLEQVRGVLLGQAIDARSDRSLLSEHAPELARQLDVVGAELDRLAALAAADTDTGPASPGIRSRRAERRQELAATWDDLVAEVRQVPGLSHFLRSMPFADLRCCASDGPVVIVNFSRHGCHCLIVTLGDLTVVPLREVTLRDALDQVQAVQDAIAAVDGTEEGWRRAHTLLAETLGWLWDSVTGPVIGELATGGPHARTLPRLWWCPTGLAAFLPLHAAGRHGGSGPSMAVIDHVVSSYTPTLHTLIDARTQAARTDGTPGQMLAVALSATPGRAKLANAKAEVKAIADLVPEATVLDDRTATRASLLAELPRHKFLHFAGHAIQDSFDIGTGALYTYDGPVSIPDLTALRLTDARLAFLSACQTAVGAMEVPDEAVHLAGALLLAGFRHVVATQWRISDKLALQIAEDFYPQLVYDGALEPAGAARALHAAIQRLRHDVPPLLWAAHIHIGP